MKEIDCVYMALINKMFEDTNVTTMLTTQLCYETGYCMGDSDNNVTIACVGVVVRLWTGYYRVSL